MDGPWSGFYSHKSTSLHQHDTAPQTRACPWVSLTITKWTTPKCEGVGDVVGVEAPLGGVAQAFHGDQVVELRVQLAVQEVEGKEEDREGQVEVEEEKRLKEVRSWMTMEMVVKMTQDLSQMRCETR